MTDDDLTGIFDNLTADDFDRPSSTFFESQPTSQATDPFTRFVDEHLVAVRFAFAAAGGAMNPMAVLASPSVERLFDPNPMELMHEYVTRLRDEARIIGATMMFFALKTQIARVDYAVGDEPDISDQDAIAEAMHGGQQFTPAVFWLAEHRHNGAKIRKQGYFEIDGRHLGKLYVNQAEQSMASLDAILGD